MNEYDEGWVEPPDAEPDTSTPLGLWIEAMRPAETPFLTHIKVAKPYPMKDVKGTHPYLYRAIAPPLQWTSVVCRWLDRTQDAIEGWAADRFHDIRLWPDHQEMDDEQWKKDNPSGATFTWGTRWPGKVEMIDAPTTSPWVVTNYPDVKRPDPPEGMPF